MAAPFPKPTVRSEPANETAVTASWDDVERLVTEVTASARECESLVSFYESLLKRMVEITGAVGGGVWGGNAHGALRLICQIPASSPLDLQSLDAAHGELLQNVIVSGRSARWMPTATDPQSQTGLTVHACAVFEDTSPCAVIELIEPRTVDPNRSRITHQLTEAMAELAGDFQRRHKLRELTRWKAARESLDEFVTAIHRSLDLDAVCYAIANEGRRLSGWDRMSVLIPKGSRYRVRAISGVDVPDRRSSLVQSMERFAQLAAAVAEPFWYDGQTQDLPPQLETALQTFLDDSLARCVAVLPLPGEPSANARTGSSAGILLLERFTAASIDPQSEPRAQWIAASAALALRNALEHRDFPLFSLWDRVRRIPGVRRVRHMSFALTSFLAFAAAFVLLAFVPADFHVEAPGELQPRIRREVFAPYDGVVQEVNVDHGSRVKAGQLLVQLRQSQVELEFTRILGELQTAKKQLDSIQATRLQRTRSSEEPRSSEDQLTSQEEELKKLVEGLEQQRAILSAQKAELQVFSPIDGQVLTWELRESLEARPVQRGQILMTVADPNGPWILELRVADEDIGYLLKARASQSARLPVRFFVATDPGIEFRGEVVRVSMSPRIDPDQCARVLVTAAITRDTQLQPRPGASVVAKIQCGQRALGFVWFHDVIEAIQKHLLF